MNKRMLVTLLAIAMTTPTAALWASAGDASLQGTQGTAAAAAKTKTKHHGHHHKKATPAATSTTTPATGATTSK